MLTKMRTGNLSTKELIELISSEGGRFKVSFVVAYRRRCSGVTDRSFQEFSSTPIDVFAAIDDGDKRISNPRHSPIRFFFHVQIHSNREKERRRVFFIADDARRRHIRSSTHAPAPMAIPPVPSTENEFDDEALEARVNSMIENYQYTNTTTPLPVSTITPIDAPTSVTERERIQEGFNALDTAFDHTSAAFRMMRRALWSWFVVTVLYSGWKKLTSAAYYVKYSEVYDRENPENEGMHFVHELPYTITVLVSIVLYLFSDMTEVHKPLVKFMRASILGMILFKLMIDSFTKAFILLAMGILLDLYVARVSLFRSIEWSNSDDDACIICAEQEPGMALYKLSCGHKIHCKCANTFLDTGRTNARMCSLCRKSMTMQEIGSIRVVTSLQNGQAIGEAIANSARIQFASAMAFFTSTAASNPPPQQANQLTPQNTPNPPPPHRGPSSDAPHQPSRRRSRSRMSGAAPQVVAAAS